MGNCCRSCKLYRKQRRNITIVLIGLDNSGKTTMAKRLAGEPVSSVLKTLGFSLITLRYHGYQIKLYDLGGSVEIRDIWSKYFMDAHGIIFMVDASDITRLEESKMIFAKLLAHENVSGKTILLLANKQDKENALDELEIVEQLNVEYVVNKYQCLTRVEICSAIAYENSKIDPGIKCGFKWLIDNIAQNYKILNARVECDMANYAASVQKDRDEWRARMRSKKEEEPDKQIPIKNGNPFLPVDQLIKKMNGQPSLKINTLPIGFESKPVLIDNYVKSGSVSSQSSNVSEITANASTMKSYDAVTRRGNETRDKGRTKKLPRLYQKHKRKFTRFNKTAPIPIDILMQESSSIKSRRKASQYSTKSDFICGLKNEPAARPKNYLTRRPATAPSRIHFSTVKVQTTGNVADPLNIPAPTSPKLLVISK